MLHSRVVAITGASRGLGRAIALAAAARGARVVVAARNDQPDAPESIHATTRAIASAGGTALAISVDVRNEAQVQSLVDQIVDRFGRIDALVNNAGLMVGDLKFVDTPPHLWRDILDTNLTGAYLCSRAVVPAMIRQGGGLIINITSGAAVRTGFLNIPYGVSKAGLDRLTLGLAAELKTHQISCVSVSPPVSATDTVRSMYSNRGEVDSWAQPPELTARAVCELLEDDTMQHSGKVLSVREYLERKDRTAQN